LVFGGKNRKSDAMIPSTGIIAWPTSTL